MSTDETLVERLAGLTPGERAAVEAAAEVAAEAAVAAGSVYLGYIGEPAVKGKDY